MVAYSANITFLFKLKGHLREAAPTLDIGALVKQQLSKQRERLGDRLKSTLKKLF